MILSRYRLPPGRFLLLFYLCSIYLDFILTLLYYSSLFTDFIFYLLKFDSEISPLLFHLILLDVINKGQLIVPVASLVSSVSKSHESVWHLHRRVSWRPWRNIPFYWVYCKSSMICLKSVKSLRFKTCTAKYSVFWPTSHLMFSSLQTCRRSLGSPLNLRKGLSHCMPPTAYADLLRRPCVPGDWLLSWLIVAFTWLTIYAKRLTFRSLSSGVGC